MGRWQGMRVERQEGASNKTSGDLRPNSPQQETWLPSSCQYRSSLRFPLLLK